MLRFLLSRITCYASWCPVDTTLPFLLLQIVQRQGECCADGIKEHALNYVNPQVFSKSRKKKVILPKIDMVKTPIPSRKNIKHHIWRGWPNVNRHAAPWGCGPFFCPEFVPVPKTRIPKMVLARHTWLEEPSVQRQTLSTWPALATPIHGWWLDYYISHLNRVLYDTWF